MSYLQPPPWHPINGEASVLSWVALSRVLLGLAVLSLDVLSLAVLSQFFSEPVILHSRQSIVNPPAINSNHYIYIYIYESGPLIACGDTA